MIVLMLLAGRTAEAQIPVTDVGAIVQLVSQLQALEQQVQTARQQLEQAQSEFQAITGDRGMERLLSGTVRNYLPATWSEIQGALAGGVQSAAAANALLTEAQLAGLPAGDRQILDAARQSAALQQLLAQQTLATTSARFASLQQLIDSIASATDQKGALDLVARIGAEQGMLQNEQSKLQLIGRSVQADDAANLQRAREQATADQGVFASRFQPTP
jgi:type IV secretion system protein VirB5